jgi:hypothetical protein
MCSRPSAPLHAPTPHSRLSAPAALLRALRLRSVPSRLLPRPSALLSLCRFHCCLPAPAVLSRALRRRSVQSRLVHAPSTHPSTAPPSASACSPELVGRSSSPAHRLQHSAERRRDRTPALELHAPAFGWRRWVERSEQRPLSQRFIARHSASLCITALHCSLRFTAHHCASQCFIAQHSALLRDTALRIPALRCTSLRISALHCPSLPHSTSQRVTACSSASLCVVAPRLALLSLSLSLFFFL